MRVFMRPVRGLGATLVICALILGTTQPAHAAQPGRGARQQLARPSKVIHARLDSRLDQLAGEVRASQRPDVAIARDAPISRNNAVAVSLRLAADADLAALHAFLTGHGASIANEAAGTVEAYVPVDTLAALADQPGLLKARAIERPTADVYDQATAVHGSDQWNANGVTGAGVKVGIIDVGFDGLANLLGGDVPAAVVGHCYSGVGSFTTNLADCNNGEVHGAGVAEAIANIAPGVQIFVANPVSNLDEHEVVAWMAAQGVSVINHSVSGGYEGPGDGVARDPNGELAAVDQAVAAGITWVNSAGNYGAWSWFGGFSDTDANGFMEWAGADEANQLYLYKDETFDLTLRWNDSWGGASSDLDLALYDSGFNVVARSTEAQDGSPGATPVEFLKYTVSAEGTYYIGVYHNSGPAPAWVQLLGRGLYDGQVWEHSTAGYSIGSPAESANPGLLAVGAARWNTPTTIEKYSSLGPTPDGRVKPDITGATCADSVSFGTGDNAFCGTSQASPHVAGLAALVKQRFPTYTPQQVASYLESNAETRGAPDPNDVWGYGFAHLPAISGPPPTGSGDFDRVWATTDQAVAAGHASYSWFWGPESFDQRFEDYQESPHHQREVRYYDKSRMEINDPNGDKNSLYYVTNGLLTEELVTGRLQLGNSTFDQRNPATQLVAGDPSNNPGTPSYAAFAPLATTDGVTHRSTDRTGQPVTQFLNGAGLQSATDSGAVTLASFQTTTGHNIASVFWNWANDPTSGFRPAEGVDWVYVLGLPISEPYWVDAAVGGQVKRVLVQLFERRVLTYTASNTPTYRIEFGNIGRHYHDWRDTSTPGNGGGGGDDTPTEGSVLYQSTLLDWPTQTSADGAAFVAGNTYHLQVSAAGFFLPMFTSEDTFGDVSAQVDARLVVGSGLSSACLLLRADVNSGNDYALCLDADGKTSAVFEGFDSSGNYFSNVLLAQAPRGGTHAVTDWNTLKIIARGSDFWFFINGTLLGKATYADGTATGAVGIYTYNDSDVSAEFEYRDLTIKAVH